MYPGILKTRVIAAYLREMKKQYEVIEYVGIAADETKRMKTACYPLVEWAMTEKDCLAYCYERGFDWGGRMRFSAGFPLVLPSAKFGRTAETVPAFP